MPLQQMSLTVIKAGLLDTIQDEGRKGFQRLGINPGGAMDTYAATLANALVGNERHSPVLELHFPASAFLFTKPALIALAGADFSPVIDDYSIPMHQPVWVNEKTRLEFRQRKNGARVYLAVHGGFTNIEYWLNSGSTHLKLKAGGFTGRALKKGDEIVTLPYASAFNAGEACRVLKWKAPSLFNTGEHTVFVIPGPEWDYLKEESKAAFLGERFIIGTQSDRMGYRLEGTLLQSKIREELVSSPVTFGTIQLLPDGNLIVLMADHQTTGGYPRIATVVTAHHGMLAQKKAGDRLQFQLIDLTTAEKLLLKQEQLLQQIKTACACKLQDFFNASK